MDPTPKPTASLRLGGLKVIPYSFEENGFLAELSLDTEAKEQISKLVESAEWADVVLSSASIVLPKTGKTMVRTYKFLGRIVSCEKIESAYAVRFHTFGKMEIGSVEV